MFKLLVKYFDLRQSIGQTGMRVILLRLKISWSQLVTHTLKICAGTDTNEVRKPDMFL